MKKEEKTFLPYIILFFLSCNHTSIYKALSPKWTPVRVYAKMDFKCPRLGERLPAHLAFVGLLSGVGPEMHLKLGTNRKLHVAEGAVVWPFPGVDTEMQPQAIRLSKLLQTHGALVRLVHLVTQQVPLEV